MRNPSFRASEATRNLAGQAYWCSTVSLEPIAPTARFLLPLVVGMTNSNRWIHV